ncbi:hypothetical protein GCM10011600_12810 [Pseudolysinimonas yzui]|uniref:Uncharacterized protein n=1 Tax=Pseudolysinimonas yzui TaxID=2708254 RepID=A0A8J3GPT7_9MICO|nr:hypothetical protein GCM10011600_12810 [Pseudolysinimonas yzui]
MAEGRPVVAPGGGLRISRTGSKSPKVSTVFVARTSVIARNRSWTSWDDECSIESLTRAKE